jgi:dipeptide/tripeptide permease
MAPIAAGLIVKWWGYTAMFNVSLVFVIAGFVLFTLNVEDPRKMSPEVPPS